VTSVVAKKVTVVMRDDHPSSCHHRRFFVWTFRVNLATDLTFSFHLQPWINPLESPSYLPKLIH
jgi:hypothetical protein